MEPDEPQAGNEDQSESKPRRIHVIINPAAGQDQPILKVMNAAFQDANVDWDVFITKEAGDGRRLAQEAAAAGADLVVVHGGDGTIMEVASGLIDSNLPFAIIPGGTANVVALELGIPAGAVEACALLLNPEADVRIIDMGVVTSLADSQAGEYYFLLRASMGFEAAMVEGADRETKDRLGVFAYAISALQTLADPPIASYRLKLDGMEVEVQGLSCIVANSGTMGISGMPAITMSSAIDISDGLLDFVVVTRSDLPGLVALVASVVGGNENPPALQRWAAREAVIEADPPQTVQVDGEIVGTTPISVRVVPGAVRVIVPPAASA